MANATNTTTTHRAVCTVSINEPFLSWSGVFEDDALDQIGHILTPVGDGFKQFVNRLELNQLAHIRLFAKQLAHGRAQHTVGIALEHVNLFAGFQRRFRRGWICQLVEQVDNYL